MIRLKLKNALNFRNSRYCETRFLSLGESISKLMIQWECLLSFFEDYLKVTERKLEMVRIKNAFTNEETMTKNQKFEIKSFIDSLKNENFKFVITFIHFILEKINHMNLIFQSETCRLHLIYDNANKFILELSEMVFHDETVNNLKINDQIIGRFDVGNEKLISHLEFMDHLNNVIDFSLPRHYGFFFVALEKIDKNIIISSQKLVIRVIELFQKYIPFNEPAIHGFQLIDIRKRKIKNSVLLFRERLLKQFVKCYEYNNEYEIILKSYQELTRLSDLEIGVNPIDYCNSKNEIDVENYWINFYKYCKSQKSFLQHSNLCKFFVNLCSIPHSNCYVERMYSQVNLIKTAGRNLLEVENVGSLLRVKSFFEDHEEFEPDETHYKFYQSFINKEDQ